MVYWIMPLLVALLKVVLTGKHTQDQYFHAMESDAWAHISTAVVYSNWGKFNVTCGRAWAQFTTNANISLTVQNRDNVED